MTAPLPMFPVGRIGHRDPAWMGDSLDGLKHSLAAGLHAQDVNVHLCAPDPECPECDPGTCLGHPVSAHYDTVAANHHHDPSGRIKGTAKVADLTLTQIRTLVAQNGRRGMDAVDSDAWLVWCALNKFALMLEWKPDARTKGARAVWAAAAHRFAAKGVRAAVMTIQAWAPAKARDRAARLNAWEAGAKARMREVVGVLPTVMLWRRGRVVSAEWRSLVSAVKSAPRVAVLGKDVTRIGVGKAPKPAPKARRRRKRRPPRRRPRRIRIRRRRARRKARR